MRPAGTGAGSCVAILDETASLGEAAKLAGLDEPLTRSMRRSPQGL